MKYKELAAEILRMTQEQLEMDVTLYDRDTDEFRPVDCVSYTTQVTDVLDENHPILNLT